MRIPREVSGADLVRRLQGRGIGTQVHYVPLHLQPYYHRRHGDLHLPGAWSYYQRCLILPLYPAMSEADVQRVVEELTAALGETGAA